MTRESDDLIILATSKDRERLVTYLLEALMAVPAASSGQVRLLPNDEEAGVTSILIQAREPGGTALLSLQLTIAEDGVTVPEWSSDSEERGVQERAWALAKNRLAGPVGSFDWWAIIEPWGRGVPDSWYECTCNTLGGVELAFQPPMIEWVPDLVRPGSAASRVTAPWVCQGSDEGIDYHDVAATALERLDKISGLLSLVTGYSWRIRRGPEPRFGGHGTVPHEPCDQDIRLPPRQMITSDLEQMLRYMDESSVVAGLVLSFAHALRLQYEAPSLCFLAFAAVVERVGFSIHPSGKCECCEGCGITIGASAQFRKGLSLAGLSETKTRNYARSLYKQRSTIAHSATLVGRESSQAEKIFVPRIFDSKPGDDFMRDDLATMRNLCRSVLASVFQDQQVREKVVASQTDE